MSQIVNITDPYSGEEYVNLTAEELVANITEYLGDDEAIEFIVEMIDNLDSYHRSEILDRLEE